MTWDSDAMNPKGEAGPRTESTSGMMTRSSAKKGKGSMKRKPRLAGSLTERRASHEADTYWSPTRKGPKAKAQVQSGGNCQIQGKSSSG
jgi:hypothetical protein